MPRTACLPLVLVLALGLPACGGEDVARPTTSPAPSVPPALEPVTDPDHDDGADGDTEQDDAAADDALVGADVADGGADASPTDAPPGQDRPDWLGTRPLAVGPSGFPPPQPTPPELDDRRLPPPASDLPAPGDDSYAASVEAVPDAVLARSTWHQGCPVSAAALRYLTVTFWGFDGAHHTGELLVHADVADDLVEVFRRLHDARFPIEEMRVIRAEELDLEPTGDGNVTTAFVCRDSRGATSWSQHAYGLAVDINPFHNPYLKGAGSSREALATEGAVVLPELATSYVDRERDRPGMIRPGDAVARAFGDIGWGWGGDWSSPKDWMHFSRSGR